MCNDDENKCELFVLRSVSEVHLPGDFLSASPWRYHWFAGFSIFQCRSGCRRRPQISPRGQMCNGSPERSRSLRVGCGPNPLSRSSCLPWAWGLGPWAGGCRESGASPPSTGAKFPESVSRGQRARRRQAGRNLIPAHRVKEGDAGLGVLAFRRFCQTQVCHHNNFCRHDLVFC